MSEPALTQQQWRDALGDVLFDATPDYFGDDGEWHPLEAKHVAAYALTLLDRAERAERELREAEEAISTIIHRADGQTPEPFKSRARQLLGEEFPAVRRALSRKGEG